MSYQYGTFVVFQRHFRRSHFVNFEGKTQHLKISRHFAAFHPTLSTYLGAQKLTFRARISKFHHFANCVFFSRNSCSDYQMFDCVRALCRIVDTFFVFVQSNLPYPPLCRTIYLLRRKYRVPSVPVLKLYMLCIL